VRVSFLLKLYDFGPGRRTFLVSHSLPHFVTRSQFELELRYSSNAKLESAGVRMKTQFTHRAIGTLSGVSKRATPIFNTDFLSHRITLTQFQILGLGLLLSSAVFLIQVLGYQNPGLLYGGYNPQFQGADYYNASYNLFGYQFNPIIAIASVGVVLGALQFLGCFALCCAHRVRKKRCFNGLRRVTHCYI
jgi:hypothetical protein